MSHAPRGAISEVRTHSCVKCAYSLEGLPHEGNCPECGTPVFESIPTALPRIVANDRYCIQCAYPLVGLAPGGNCPECGTSIALSLGESTLAAASRDYVTIVHRGLSLVLNAILLFIVACIGAMVAYAFNAQTSLIDMAFQAVTLVVAAMMLVGYWLYTSPDPGQVAKEKTNSSRAVVRSIVQLQTVLALTSLGLRFLSSAQPRWASDIGMAAAVFTLISFVLWIVHFFAMMRYTRWIATRVPDMYIIKRTRRYMWLLPTLAILFYVVVFIGPLLALIKYWKLLDRLRKHTKSILKNGRPAPLKGMLATGR